MDPTPDLNAALSKAQAEMGPALKDRDNPAFRSKYADLASVIEACRPLSGHGLAFVQRVATEGARVSVTTELRHVSGQVLDCGTATATGKDAGPQSIGSVLTYLRRYGLMAAVGIGPADDDGNAGQGVPEPAPKAKRESPAAKAERQADHDPSWTAGMPRYFARLAELGVSKSEADAIAEHMGRPRPSCLPQANRDAFLAFLATEGGQNALAAIQSNQPSKE
jgi:hypothetical protein